VASRRKGNATLERYGLCTLPPPFAVEAMPHRFVWSRRLGNDPAVSWIRNILSECFAEVLRDCEAEMAAARARTARRRMRSRAPRRP
jgi:hypothetical protein